MPTRRQFSTLLLAASAAALVRPSLAATAPLAASDAARARMAHIEARLRSLEARAHGRLGVAVLDSATGLRAGVRADERFPMCSTFKALLAAAVLARVDAGQESLARRIVYSHADLVAYSPTTGHHVGAPGMTVAELCEAAVTLSDNTAANLLLGAMNGPAGLTAFVRHIGDPLTRLDRNEPSLNEAIPGDPRDTTTPRAMADDLRTLLLDDALSPASRRQWQAWLVANKTGDHRLRAHLPPGWRVGDKTGTGERGTANDAGILWPPHGAPVFVTVYLTGANGANVHAAQRDATIAEVGRIVSHTLAGA